jgi:hypothetical protein
MHAERFLLWLAVEAEKRAGRAKFVVKLQGLACSHQQIKLIGDSV